MRRVQVIAAAARTRGVYSGVTTMDVSKASYRIQAMALARIHASVDTPGHRPEEDVLQPRDLVRQDIIARTIITFVTVVAVVGHVQTMRIA